MAKVAVGLVVFAAVAGAAAFALGWFRSPTERLGAVVVAFVVLTGAALLQRQAGQRNAAILALDLAEARVGEIVAAAMDPIITVDQAQRIVLFNMAAERVFQRSRDAVLGQRVDLLIPARFRADHACHIERFGETGQTTRRMGGRTIALMALRANGEEFPIDASISHHREGGASLYTVILRDVTERARAEEALRASRQELQQLASAAHAAREQEQSRFARELHDELGQALTALKMMVAWIEQRTGRDDLELAGKLERMANLIDNTLQATRRISAALRPLILDDLGLLPALESVVEGFVDRTGIACDFSADGELEFEDTRKSAVFRIVQEALTNVARHAKATQVAVRIAHDDGTIVVDVRDNGVGFDLPDKQIRHSRGMLGMRERAHLLGGTFSIASAPGQGTRLEIRIPVGDSIGAS